jgi:hypothetical protein
MEDINVWEKRTVSFFRTKAADSMFLQGMKTETVCVLEGWYLHTSLHGFKAQRNNTTPTLPRRPQTSQSHTVFFWPYAVPLKAVPLHAMEALGGGEEV